MGDMMTFPATVEEFMEQYKMTDTEHVYSNGTEYVPIYRMKQWFEHCRNQWSGGVEDRLPENGGYVVCIAKRNPFSRFMPMVARIEKNGWVNPITEQYISEVTHWMPLPDTPKEVT